MRHIPYDGLGITANMTLAQRMELYERVIDEQRSIINVLKGALAGQQLQAELTEFRPWMLNTSPQVRALVGALLAVSPRPVSCARLLEALPSQDHAVERDPHIVQVIVNRARSHLAAELDLPRMETVILAPRTGYFLTREVRDRLLS